MPLNRRTFLTASALATPLLTSGSQLASAAPRPGTAGDAAGRSGPVPGRAVRPGADVLADDGWKRLAGRKVGVLSNPTGVLVSGDHIVDSLIAAGVRPVAAFGPEHGFRGSAQAGGSEGDYEDPRTGVPVYDAYGATIDELARMYRKSGVDTVVFDIADVGSRFYTYIWAMYEGMAAAARVGVEFVVLDRPNPIGGSAFGPTLDPKFSSGVGLKPIVLQHGMTAGELARLFNNEFLPEDGGKLDNLDVIETRGWKRDRLFSQTDLVWTPPSPNMPTPNTALAYPGTCLFEGTVFSEGRGTTSPFEILGAPGVDWKWREALQEQNLPGVSFRETYFVPTFGKFTDEQCGGVQLNITDPHAFEPIRTGIAMIVTAKRVHPKLFGWREDNFIDKLFGSDRLRSMVNAGAGTDEIIGSWADEIDGFRRNREQYLIYR
ncbi:MULTISPECIES: exo-beta-N-acetylmuramidase NamZ family protein [Prauserella salsuginis group]|uniref:Uncharacterized protein YbbC (DUF1343 family) n=2 Tax=Prauserella salsuginis group TaxID=2893672 RepID=A0A839XP55_9PSEU|nr:MULTISPECIES: DUF1343 domain-containing protein [Prauserella salsuginis group]MBB3663274.1 uncharacterized protein YbbC (DUF1343 family) [Prauserella sediminis]MCR3720899.1 Uncharacterized conserved protein YbbC, DUF1343 family [Prauserella flava]MCR3735020.1 Uncharacterized conserved protein YbbC, DUF1343 family [Prauserella salsuginis]